ncbi:MAG: MBL fold metallo-hydrolase, partial [Deltaproteobacteria bacterium]|nr:MBL fold metallo-hydrolase [Deltaproteobacteria bacterium]
LMHEGELPVMAGLIASQTVYQFGDHQVPEVDEYLSPDKVLELGELRIKVMETPGHSPGGVCFIVNDAVFTGDSLFDGSIGRTDLPGGSMPTLMDSIKTRILSLDDAFKVYPGHGPFTTIGKERQSNPFLTGDGFF